MCFAVHNDTNRFIQVGRLIHKNVADAFGMAKHGNRAVLHNMVHESVAAARDDQVDAVVKLQHLIHILTCVQQVGPVIRQTGCARTFQYCLLENLIGLHGFTAAFQQHGIPAF